MLTQILIGIVIYGMMGIFVFLLARMSIRHEISKHPDPPYNVVLPFIKMVYSIAAVAYVLVVIASIIVLHVP